MTNCIPHIMTSHTSRAEIHAAFATSNLSDFPIFADSDIVTETESHHYNLSPHSSLTSPSSPTSLTSQTLSEITDTLSSNSLTNQSSILLQNPSSTGSPPANQVNMASTLATTAAPTATPIPMPMHSDRTTPQFNPTKPRELCRFFDNLQYILNCTQVTSKNEMKHHAIRYMDIDTSELWETYEEFKTMLQDLYPESKEECKWMVVDMDQLIGEQSHLGILSLAYLGNYYRQFLAITTFLKGKNHLLNNKQSHTFARGFLADL